MRERKINGKLILDEVSVNRILDRVVIKNNKTSGKITVPKKLIGKKVYLVWEAAQDNG